MPILKKWWACSVQLSSYGCTREVIAECDSSFLCTLLNHHFFYNIDAFNIFAWIEVFIEPPACMRLKVNGVFSISDRQTTSNCSVNLNIKVITNENCCL